MVLWLRLGNVLFKKFIKLSDSQRSYLDEDKRAENIDLVRVISLRSHKLDLVKIQLRL